MPKDMTSIRQDRLSRVMAFLQSGVRASHDEIFSVGEYNSNRTLQNDLHYLRGVYDADIQYDNRRKLYVMESAGIFQLDLKITKYEIEALTAGLRMISHGLKAGDIAGSYFGSYSVVAYDEDKNLMVMKTKELIENGIENIARGFIHL